MYEQCGTHFCSLHCRLLVTSGAKHTTYRQELNGHVVSGLPGKWFAFSSLLQNGSHLLERNNHMSSLGKGLAFCRLEGHNCNH